MRTPIEHVAKDGTKTYKVKFRIGGQYTSETFRLKQLALSFASILDAGGPAEALAWLRAKEAADDAWTFGEWFDHHVDHLTGVDPRTKDDYKAQKRRYFSHLDEFPLSSVTRAHIAELVNTMDAAGYKPKTIKNAVHLIASVMASAVEEGHVTRNPAKKVRLPKERVTDDEDDTEDARFLTHEEFSLLLAEIPPYWRPLVVFLVGTGLRWSEATALKTRHVSIPDGTVKVRQAWKKRTRDEEKGTPGGFVIGPPKSEKSRRTVNAATQALAVVAPLLKGNDFVFRSRQGTPVSHSNFFNRVWKPATVRLSICPEHMLEGCKCGTAKPNTCPRHQEKDARGHQILPPPCGCAGTLPFRPRPHDLRHTHASWLIAEGKSLEQIQDQLGHESILTTRQVYGHLLPALGVEVGRAASAALARVVMPAGELTAKP